MKKFLKQCLRKVDETYLDGFLKLFPEKSGIRCILFHSVFLSEEEIEFDHILPQQSLTVDNYRNIFEYFLTHGYTFLSHSSLNEEIDPAGKYIYVTFDDGYFNNIRILPVLEEYGVPAHLFVCPYNILEGKKFWWDVVYSERKKMDVPQRQIVSEISQLKSYKYDWLEKFLVDEFGAQSLQPISDTDRPLTSGELVLLNENKWITIGNHTNHHAIVTNRSLEDIRSEIIDAQDSIENIVGRIPKTFAFPNGDYRSEHIELLQSLNFDIGITCAPRINKVPEDVQQGNRLNFGRYCFMGNTNLQWQCNIFRAGMSPYLIALKFWTRERKS